MRVLIINEDNGVKLVLNITTTACPEEAQYIIRQALPVDYSYWTAYNDQQWLSSSEL
jgi:hypothetical protein